MVALTGKLQAAVVREPLRLLVRFAGGEIFFESPDAADLFGETDDFAVWALLPRAMATGGELVIDGSVHEATMRNAEEFSRIWSLWLPEKFRRVHVSAARVRTGRDETALPSGRGSLLALSGGVDSTHALLRHRSGENITHTLTVHGFDYKLDAPEVLASLSDRTRAISRLADAENITLRTNLRKYIPDWEMAHGAALAAVLHVFYGSFSRLLLASDWADYESFLIFPWGNNHVTNALFSLSPVSAGVLDGDVCRAQKIASVMRRQDVARLVTVCWQDGRQAGNCGQCAKCLRTKLITRAVHGTALPMFDDDSIDMRQVRGLQRQCKKGHAVLQASRISFVYAREAAIRRGDGEMADILERLIHACENPGLWSRIVKCFRG